VILNHAFIRASAQIAGVAKFSMTGTTIPTTGSPAAFIIMHPLTRTLAVTMASTDGVPRLIAHSNTLFLVTPRGDVWRVLDSDGPDGDARSAPRNDPRVWARIFIGSGSEPIVRIYRFRNDESRAITPDRIHAQLRDSTIGDERED
jgi:hypothetical protein